MPIYLDNAASTKVSDEAIKSMVEVMSMDYGNPSSIHKMGLDAEKKMKSFPGDNTMMRRIKKRMF